MSSTASSLGSAKRKRNRSKSSSGSNKINKNKQQSSGPLVPPPHRLLPSRKRARKMTTEFHKLLKEQEQHQQQKAVSSSSSRTNTDNVESTESDTVLQKVNEQIEKSRQDYQRASQVSTSFHSTSKWVLGVLAQNGWLYGRKISSSSTLKHNHETEATKATRSESKKKKKEKPKRRPTRLLEIGAINTELLDSATVVPDNTATATHNTSDSDEDDSSLHDVHGEGNVGAMLKHRPTPVRKQGGGAGGGDGRLLQVRAIDIHSMDPRIEEADFLALPNDDSNVTEYYDVIVCSMVLNCGMTPTRRGDFIRKMCHFLQPNGLLFLTLPKTCLQLSPYINQAMFTHILEAVGLSVSSTRESPKITFFICTKQSCRLPPVINKKHDHDHANSHSNDGKWTTLSKIRRGKKYRNDFAIVLAPTLADEDDL